MEGDLILLCKLRDSSKSIGDWVDGWVVGALKGCYRKIP